MFNTASYHFSTSESNVTELFIGLLELEELGTLCSSLMGSVLFSLNNSIKTKMGILRGGFFYMIGNCFPAVPIQLAGPPTRRLLQPQSHFQRSIYAEVVATRAR